MRNLKQQEKRNKGRSVGLFANADNLCSRLREFENELNDDDVARHFYGHVAPALARTEGALCKARAGNAQPQASHKYSMKEEPNGN